MTSCTRKNLPRKVFLSGAAIENDGNQVAWWLPTPFRFCLQCGVSYSAHQQSDFGKLATLGSEGRSTATTVMTLSAIRRLRKDDELEPKARAAGKKWLADHRLSTFMDRVLSA